MFNDENAYYYCLTSFSLVLVLPERIHVTPFRCLKKTRHARLGNPKKINMRLCTFWALFFFISFLRDTHTHTHTHTHPPITHTSTCGIQQHTFSTRLVRSNRDMAFTQKGRDLNAIVFGLSRKALGTLSSVPNAVSVSS